MFRLRELRTYTKIYYNYFDFGFEDFVPCEICGDKAVDIHHIIARSKEKSLENDINNLIGICRRCHLGFGDRTHFLEFLQATHKLYMTSRRPLYEVDPQAATEALTLL